MNISLMFVPKGQINNIPALVEIMAWRRPGDKPLSQPMMFKLLTHICVTRPQWVEAHNRYTDSGEHLKHFRFIKSWLETGYFDISSWQKILGKQSYRVTHFRSILVKSRLCHVPATGNGNGRATHKWYQQVDVRWNGEGVNCCCPSLCIFHSAVEIGRSRHREIPI